LIVKFEKIREQIFFIFKNVGVPFLDELSELISDRFWQILHVQYEIKLHQKVFGGDLCVQWHVAKLLKTIRMWPFRGAPDRDTTLCHFSFVISFSMFG